MSIFDDIFGTASDVATSILDRAPGGGWVRAAYDQGEKWILAAAKSPAGSWMIDVVTNSVGIPALIPIVGPAATALWAAPGILKGDPFVESYVRGFTQRLVQLAQYLAGQGASEALQKQAADAMSSQVQEIASDPAMQDAIARLATQQTNDAIKDTLVQMHLTPEEIAARFGVRPDAAAMAIDLLLKKNVYNPNEFQVSDGQRPVPVVNPATGPLQSSAFYLQTLTVAKSALSALQAAQQQGIPGTDKRVRDAGLQVQQLEQLYETALSQENSNKDATYQLTQLLLAEKAGAPPEQIAKLKQNYAAAISRQNLSGSGLAFDTRGAVPLTFGKPDVGTVLLDVGVVGVAFYLIYRLGKS